MPKLTIRHADEGDERALAHLDAGSWPADLQVAPPQPADEAFFTTWRRPEDVIVGLRDGAIAGYLRLGRHVRLPINDHVLHIDALVVAAPARGQGIGASLLDAGIAEARRRGAAKLGLRALSNNSAALSLYRSRGFAEEGRLRAEFRRPDGSYADDVWMALWLRVPPSPPTGEPAA